MNLKEEDVDNEVMRYLDMVSFSESELEQIEAGAKSGLEKVATKRNRELDDLYKQRKRIYADLDYLKKNKITLLRNETSTPQEYTADTLRLEGELDEVNEKIKSYDAAEHEMLQYILTFSELVKRARLYYEHALDTERHAIIKDVFTELTFMDGKLANVKAKEGYEALFSRHDFRSGSVYGTMLEPILRVFWLE